MSFDPNVALATRRDLSLLRDRHDALLLALSAVRDAPGWSRAVDLAFELGGEFGGIAGVGELASRHGDERDALISATTDTDEARSRARALVAAVREGRVFRALRHVFPSSFRSVTLEAADRYREKLRALPDRPLWPESTVTLRDVYVPPACRLERTDEDEDGVPCGVSGEAFEDPADALRAYFGRHDGSDLFVTGGPGFGKSTVLTMLAASLADDRDVLPVLAQGYVNPRAVRGPEPRWLRVALLVRDDPFEPELLPRIVRFTDGEFERPLAREPSKYTSILGAGRNRWGGSDRPGLVLDVLPLDEERVRRWVDRWNARATTPLDAAKLLASFPDDEPLSLNLAATPFTLVLLARMVVEGHELPRSARLRDRAAFYRDVISWACAAAGSNRGSRDELRDAAEASLRDSSGERTSDTARFGSFSRDLVPSWVGRGGNTPRFPLATGTGNAVAFFHESFAEYLIAERLAFECHRLRSTALDVGGARRPAGEEVDLARRWLRAFGLVTLDTSLESLLRVMIPTWESFAQGGRRTPAGFAESWRSLADTLYRQLAADASWAFVVDIAAELEAPPSVVRARSLFSLLRLGGIVDASRLEAFEPEHALPGSFAKVLALLRMNAHALPDSSLEGAVSLRGAQCSGTDFAGADLAGVDLTGAQLVRADLRGADLRRARLDGANLRRARLDGANLDGATLSDAVLTLASVSGVRLTDAQRSAAAWTNADAIARGLPAEDEALSLLF